MAQTAETISVHCECGKKLKAPASAVGRKAKCPGCGNVLTITPPPPPEPVEDDGLGALYDLADAEKSAAASNQVDDSPHCPKCAAQMDSGAVLCVNCGYDMRTKSKLGAAPASVARPPVIDPDFEKKMGKKKPVDKMAPQGKFIVGLGLSAAFAAAAGLLWYIITWKTDRDFYILSALIGIGAGAGMQIGQKGYSKLGGVMAALVTMVVILSTRVAIVLAVLAPEISGGHDSSLDKYDERVVNMLVEQNLKAAGVEDPDDASEKQQEKAEKQALAKLKSMNDAEYQAQVKKAAETEEIDELVTYKVEKAVEGKNPSNFGEAIKMHTAAERAARATVMAMTPAQRQAELKKFHGDEDAAAAKASAEEAKSPKGHGGGASAAVAVGAVVILLLIFGLWPLLVMIMAMGIAYKTAAGVVSD